MRLLSEADRRRVEAAVTTAEAGSAGEVVVAVLRRAHDYALPRGVVALALGVGLALALHHLLAFVAGDWIVLSVLPSCALAYALLGAAPLLRLIVPTRLIDEAVQARALTLFAEHGLYQTRDGSGVLVFVAELEHRVVILGDRGVDALVRERGWQPYVDALLAAIRDGHAADGLVRVVGELGALLATAFPRRADDRNELPDRVIHED